MGRRLGAKERPSEKKLAACALNGSRAKAMPTLEEREQLRAIKADLRDGLQRATPRLLGMLNDPDTPPGLFVELYKLIAPKVGLSDRVEQAVAGLEQMAPMIVVVGGDAAAN